MKLRAQFSIAATVLVALAVTSISTVLFLNLKKMMISEIDNNHIGIVKNFAQVCREGEATGDEILLLNYIKAMKRTNDIVEYAIFVNLKKDTIISDMLMSEVNKLNLQGRKKVQSVGSADFFVVNRSGENKVIEIIYPVKNYGKTIGVVKVGFSFPKMEEIVSAMVINLRNKTLAVSGVVLLVAIIFSLLLSLGVTKPLEELVRGAEKVGQGQLDVKLNVKLKNEVGELAVTFNKMVEDLKKLDEMKQSFISSVSHELKTPLAAIQGYAVLLGKKPPSEIAPEKFSRFLRIINESTKRLTRFINDILDMAKLEAGVMTLHKDYFDLNKTGKEVLELLTPMASQKQVQLIDEIPESFPKVNADEERIRQIYTNLVGNALKFTPEHGTITILAEDKPSSVLFGVKDTGPGIPREQLKTIFQKFKQVEGVRNQVTGPKGTGLGLAIVKGIIDAHEGKVWAESEPGMGATFYFEIPK